MTNKLSCFGLPSKTIQKIHGVFKSYPEIKQVCIYGSRAKGNYHPGSDIDLVIMDDLIKDSRLNKLEIDLDDLLLPYKLDLTVFQKIQNQDLIDHINRVGILFYTKFSLAQRHKEKITHCTLVPLCKTNK